MRKKMYFDHRTSIRLTKHMRKLVEEIVRKNPDKYESTSHLMRCAIIKLHRMEVLEKNV